MRYRVVLVDDSPDELLLVRDAIELASMPIELFTFCDPGEALAFLRTQPRVDLVITDLQLGLLNGTALLKQMLDEHALRALPIAVMTGMPMAMCAQDHEAYPFFPKANDWKGYLRLAHAIHASLVSHDAEPCTPHDSGPSPQHAGHRLARRMRTPTPDD